MATKNCKRGQAGNHTAHARKAGRRLVLIPRGRAVAPLVSGGAVSLSEPGTVSSFLFLFWVLLAKHCDVYTSGYYICQNNYSMTNGSST